MKKRMSLPRAGATYALIIATTSGANERQLNISTAAITFRWLSGIGEL